MVNLLFAGIKIPSLITRYRCQKLLTQEVIFSAENRPVFDRNAGRLHVGIRNRRPLSMATGFASASFIDRPRNINRCQKNIAFAPSSCNRSSNDFADDGLQAALAFSG
jgi:hypothetical protein